MWVSITARDMYGNPRTQGGDASRSRSTGQRHQADGVVDRRLRQRHVQRHLPRDGRGQLSLYVQRADTTGVFWDIKGSPFNVAVSTGPTNPFVSRLVGRHEVVAGEGPPSR